MTDPPQTPWNDGEDARQNNDSSCHKPRDSADLTLPRHVFEPLIQAVTAFEANVTVTCTANKIHVHGTDESREGWVDVTLQPAAIHTAPDTPGTEFGIDTHRLKNVIERYDQQSPVTITLNSEANHVTAAADAMTYTSETVLPGTVPQVLAPQSPTRPVVVHLPGDALTDAVWLADQIATHVTIGWDAATETVYVAATGDTDSFRLEFTVEDATPLPGIDMKTVVAVDKLSRIETAIPADQRVRISFGATTTLRFAFAFANGAARAAFTLRSVGLYATNNESASSD